MQGPAQLEPIPMDFEITGQEAYLHPIIAYKNCNHNSCEIQWNETFDYESAETFKINLLKEFIVDVKKVSFTTIDKENWFSVWVTDDKKLDFWIKIESKDNAMIAIIFNNDSIYDYTVNGNRMEKKDRLCISGRGLNATCE